MRPNPRLYPFDEYRFEFFLKIISMTLEERLQKPVLDPFPVEDISDVLSRVYKDTFDKLIPKEELETVRRGYRHIVYPSRIEVELPVTFVFASVEDGWRKGRKDQTDNHSFSIRRKASKKLFVVTLVGFAILFIIYVALKTDSAGLNVQSLGVLATVLASRTLLLSEADVFPTVLDVVLMVVFLSLLFILIRKAKPASSTG